MNRRFEEVEHTADIALRVRGRDLPGLFANAAHGMACQLAELSDAKSRAEQLRGQAARWQQTLSDGTSDLTADVEHDLRLRIRQLSADAELLIDDQDPGKTWADFEREQRRRYATLQLSIDELRNQEYGQGKDWLDRRDFARLLQHAV